MDKGERDEYSAAPAIFKSLIGQIFGESDQISVDDGQGGTDKIIFSGDIQGIASYTAQLEHDRALLQLNLYYDLLLVDFLEEIDAMQLSVDESELGFIADDVRKYLDGIDDYEFEYEVLEHYDDDVSTVDAECIIECNIILTFEPLFSDAKNLMYMIKCIDTKIRDIIKKSTYD